MKPTTFDCLLAHFAGSPIAPLEDVAHLLQIDKDTLVEKMKDRRIGLMYFRTTDTQKGKKFVMVADLADHIDACHQKALQDVARAS